MNYKKFSSLWTLIMGAFAFLYGFEPHSMLFFKLWFFIIGTFIMGMGVNGLYEITVVSKEEGSMVP